MDRFLAMQTFVRAARSRSFTRTATQLGISRSLVTRHIAALEQSLGVTLFNRSTRSVLLTEDGASYLQSCERILLDVESTERALTQGRGKPTGMLSITAPKSFGTLHLADAIIDFAKAQPDIRVSLTLGDFTFRAQDFVASGHDVAIRTVDIRDSSIIARRIGTFQFVLCATPLYIAEMGQPKDLDDLATHRCLVHSNSAEYDRRWNFTGPHGATTVKITGDYLSNSSLALRKAALAHLGIGLVPHYCVADDLASGALVEVLPAYRPQIHPILVAYPHGVAPPAKVRVFVAFLAKWFAQRPEWAQPKVRVRDNRRKR
ncbi:MAG TPA: LysR family transcriptional regulator [Beijerinckiaceae bacterium]|jgi:DNA-binding transcriptional LysR family regulator|nr:LysR family transcriptional regulator [Beijerinckiaceae bacterium]